MNELDELPIAKIGIARIYSQLAYDQIIVSKNLIHYKSRLTSAEAFLVRLPTWDILAFKGSQEPLDWIINATALPFPNRAGLCHAGFGLAHWSLWRQIKKDINPFKTLLITGHSLGGACAEISAALLSKHKPAVSMITFGKPNVWVKGHAPDMSHLEHQVSVVNGSDIVARIPRKFFGPSESQHMLYFGLDGQDYLNPSKKLLRSELSKRHMLKHHSLALYDKRFSQLTNRMRLAQ
jgi:hypothetical protein